jgi:hypothetical protein
LAKKRLESNIPVTGALGLIKNRSLEPMKQVENIAITNPNHAWVVSEFEKLSAEWLSWHNEVVRIQDHPYDRNTQSEVLADGEDNMRKHDILQAKTLTFLKNNIIGHGFISGFDGEGIDRTDLRLQVRVKHRMHELDMLRVCLEYAKVPDSFWKQKGKELVEKLLKKSGDAAVDIAASYLRNPMAGDK